MAETAYSRAHEALPSVLPLQPADADGILRLTVSGRWTVREFAQRQAEIEALQQSSQGSHITGAEIDLAAIEELDTAGAWLIDSLRRKLEAAGVPVHLRNASEKQTILLGVVRDGARQPRPEPSQQKTVVPFLAEAANAIFEALADISHLTAFLGMTTICAARAALRPLRFRWISFIHHIDHTGLRAVPIISLICVLVGGVITQQGIVQLRAFQAEPFAVDMLGILALREVGILLTSIVVAGRSASAFTAEIGSMKMREEIDAMRTLGLDPIETLVLPRIAALVVVVPILAFIGDLMCLVGGAAMAMIYLDVDLAVYIQRLHQVITLKHFAVGLVKAPLAALIIGLVGCLEGLSVRGSAESLGRHVTAAVVKAIFLVIIFDALFAMFLSAAGY
jgi:phospholipid/cholesterol/gamma-HCH transport system permease protein